MGHKESDMPEQLTPLLLRKFFFQVAKQKNKIIEIPVGKIKGEIKNKQ